MKEDLVMKMQQFRKITIGLLLPVLYSTASFANQNELVRIINLEGFWKYSIGEREEWVSAEYDDHQWESVYVPSPWEDQGFHGYNGFGFYRKQFTLSDEHKGKTLYLNLGYIDDVDETYINGHKIGSTGSFPPSYETAYNANRIYYIPGEFLNFNGSNTISVKVYDSYQYGGIVKGDIGIYANKFDVQLDINLQGVWKFKTGDDFSWKDPGYDDSGWNEVFVPAKWEDQGYRDYDGYAWYRKTFYYKDIPGETIILVLGKIDDLDQVYINGKLVGGTGDLTSRLNKRVSTGEHYRAFRGYYISSEFLKKNQKNVIAVRVYDGQGAGGIYEGPVGLISQKKYIRFWHNRSRNN
jgi:sialate O-acetylesterase